MLPALFVSHGAPTLPLDDVPARTFLRELGQRYERPKAILCASAHWETAAPALSTPALNETIHDFYGFPEPLYRLRYAAPGAPDLAQRVAAMTGAVPVAEYGLDHGAWVPAMLGWPEADIPIFQLAVQPYATPAHHIALGRSLTPLREEGVLVMGSGSATHNLRRLIRGQHDTPPEPWAQQFDDWVAEKVEAGDEAALANYRSEAPFAKEAHPTDEHFLPLHVAFGAAGEGARGKALHRSFTSGNLSMAAYAFA
jgi:4,5-DOPA dioxygenase extradiol